MKFNLSKRTKSKLIAGVFVIILACVAGTGVEKAETVNSNQQSSANTQSQQQNTNTSTSVPSEAEPNTEASNTTGQVAQKATVTKVIDGDTIRADINGENYKIRLIGVDTPESVSSDSSKNCEEGEIASEYTKSQLEIGKSIWLTKDTSDTDKYERLLRYVWIEAPTPSPTEDEIKQKMFNAILVENGYAQAKEYKPDTQYSELFASFGEDAINQNLGVVGKWA